MEQEAQDSQLSNLHLFGNGGKMVENPDEFDLALSHLVHFKEWKILLNSLIKRRDVILNKFVMDSYPAEDKSNRKELIDKGRAQELNFLINLNERGIAYKPKDRREYNGS